MISTRKLYSEPFTFTPQFKTFFACNKLPKIDGSDGGG
jgi:phage/plasmid-associated DNA primase